MEDTNRLIAEFMGMQDTDLGWYDSEDVMSEYACQMVGGNTFEVLQYDRSWDWLMPVVEKIEDVGSAEVVMNNEECTISAVIVGNEYHHESIGKSRIDAVYQSVVEFIKWYNKNK